MSKAYTAKQIGQNKTILGCFRCNTGISITDYHSNMLLCNFIELSKGAMRNYARLYQSEKSAVILQQIVFRRNKSKQTAK